jgi:hypothetical protein
MRTGELMVIVAPGRAPAVSSTSLPIRRPVVVWVNAGNVTSNMATTAIASDLNLIASSIEAPYHSVALSRVGHRLLDRSWLDACRTDLRELVDIPVLRPTV